MLWASGTKAFFGSSSSAEKPLLVVSRLRNLRSQLYPDLLGPREPVSCCDANDAAKSILQFTSPLPPASTPPWDWLPNWSLWVGQLTHRSGCLTRAFFGFEFWSRTGSRSLNKFIGFLLEFANAWHGEVTDAANEPMQKQEMMANWGRRREREAVANGLLGKWFVYQVEVY